MPIATRRLGFESVNHHAGSQFAAKSGAALRWTIKPIVGIHHPHGISPASSAPPVDQLVDHVAPARRTGADGPLLWLRNRNRSVTSNAATRPWQVTRARRSPRGGKLRPISWHWR